MTKGLVYSTRGVTSPIFHHYLQMMQYVETVCDTVDFFSPYATERPLKHVQEVSKLKFNKHVNHLVDAYHEKFIHMKTWDEIYDAIDIEFLKDYDDIFIYGGLFSTASNLRRYTKRNGVFPRDSGQIKFQSVAIPCVYILAILKANRVYNTRVHELALEPLEMSLDLFHADYTPKSNHFLYHGHSKNSLNISRLDYFQYYLLKKSDGLFEVEKAEKTIDFTFGLTVIEQVRQKYEYDARDFIKQFPNSRFYIRNKLTGEDNYVDRLTYFDQLAKSKYTMIVPAYDTTMFSVYRLMEALYCDCLPFIHPDCYLDDMNESFGIDFGRLVVDKPWSEEDRLKLLEEFKSKVLTVACGFKR